MDVLSLPTSYEKKLYGESGRAIARDEDSTVFC